MGWFGGLHGLIAIIAIIDIIRSKSPFFWFWVVLFFPGIGPIVYFLMVRAPWGNNPLALPINISWEKKSESRRQLRELEARASSWRGAGLLSEIGEHYLVLEKYQLAETTLSEAYEQEKNEIHLTYSLAKARMALDKKQQALPLLEEVCKKEADFDFGQALLLLARCQQEAGDLEAAEQSMVLSLKRHAFFEARFRLAFLLAKRGEKAEAKTIINKMLVEWQAVPPKLRRAEKMWISHARNLSRELGQ